VSVFPPTAAQNPVVLVHTCAPQVLLVFVQDVAFKECLIICALLLFISLALHGLAYRAGQCKVRHCDCHTGQIRSVHNPNNAKPSRPQPHAACTPAWQDRLLWSSSSPRSGGRPHQAQFSSRTGYLPRFIEHMQHAACVHLSNDLVGSKVLLCTF